MEESEFKNVMVALVYNGDIFIGFDMTYTHNDKFSVEIFRRYVFDDDSIKYFHWHEIDGERVMSTLTPRQNFMNMWILYNDVSHQPQGTPSQY